MSLAQVQLLGPAKHKRQSGTVVRSRYRIPAVVQDYSHARQAMMLEPLYLPLLAFGMVSSMLTGGKTHNNNLLEEGPDWDRGPGPWN